MQPVPVADPCARHIPARLAIGPRLARYAGPPGTKASGERFRTQASGSAAMPGNSRPSRNSNDAPPPVEMWSMRSATPASSMAATESPPPTTVKASASATQRAMPRVPAAKAGRSKTPIGPFQKTVLAPCDLPAVAVDGLRADVEDRLVSGTAATGRRCRPAVERRGDDGVGWYERDGLLAPRPSR